MTTRLTQRERLQRARMAARHHVRTKAAGGGGKAADDDDAGALRQGRSAASADAAVEGRGDAEDAENRDSSNVGAARTAPAKGAASKEGAASEAPRPAAATAPNSPSLRPAASAAPPSLAGRGTARERATALSDAKRKLAASRAASAAAAEKMAAVETKKKKTVAAVADNGTSASSGGALVRRADQLSRLRAKARSRSPKRGASPSFDARARDVSSGMAAAKAGYVASKSDAAETKGAAVDQAGTVSRPAAMKSQRERFMRMKAAKSPAGANRAEAGPPPPASPNKPRPSPERAPTPNPPPKAPSPTNEPAPPSPARAIPDVPPATSYRTQRELYLRMRAMEEAGLEPEDDLTDRPEDDLTDAGSAPSVPTSPADDHVPGPPAGSKSAETVDSSAFLGVVSASESEEAEDPPLHGELTTAVSEEETLDGEGVLPSVSEESEEVVLAPEVGGEAAAPATDVSDDANEAADGFVERSKVAEAPQVAPNVEREDVVEPKSAQGVETSTDIGANEDVDRSKKTSDVFAKFDAFDEAWPDDHFSSNSWGSTSPATGEDKWSDPFSEVVGDTKSEPAKVEVGAANDDDWPRVASMPWEGDGNAEGAPGLTKVKFLPNENDDKENLGWNVDDVFGAEKEQQADESMHSMAMHENETDEQCLELQGVQESSSSASCEWDGIGEESVLGNGDAKEQQPQADSKEVLADEVKEAASAQYEGFGSVLSAGRLRGKTDSGDEDESYDEEDGDIDNLLDDEVDTKASEDTVGSATEFDPISMFGECDEVSPEIEDAFPSDGTAGVASTDNTSTGNAAGSLSASWMTPALPGVKPDDSKSISFPSLNSGSQIKYSMQSTSAKAPVVPMDSPAGTESLESWWQSRYASTQNSDINSAVQEALMKREDIGEVAAAAPGDAPEVTSERKEIASRQQKRTKLMGTDEEDSIFSGLDDDASLPSIHQQQLQPRPTLAANKYNSISTRATARASNTTAAAAAIAVNESDEDLFSGMSVGSRQLSGSKLSSHFPRLKEANAMKSLLDGASTAESPSIQQPCPPPPKTANQESKKATDEAIKEEAASPRLFLPERGYGVVTAKIEHSPTATSVTSDITSSVIFGGDKDLTKKTASLRNNNNRPLGILETTDEAIEPQELSQPSQTDVTLTSADVVSPLADEQRGQGGVDIGHGQNQEMNQELSSSRGVSLVRHSANESTRSWAGELSASSGGGKSTAATSAPSKSLVSETVNKVKASFLSQFACGVFDTSSFAFCATPAVQEEFPSLTDGAGKAGGGANGSHAGSNLNDESLGEEPSNEKNEGEESPTSSDEEYNKSSSRFYATQESYFTEEDVTLSIEESKKQKDGDEENPKETEAHRKETVDTQTKAYESLLLYAYTALSVPPPTAFVEKGEGSGTELYPSVFCPNDAVHGCEAMDKILAKLSSEGMEVLKLSREKKWQPRFLTITRETKRFKKSDDIRFRGIDACPKGLLWMKKFDARHRTVASLDKGGKGGMLFDAIQRVSVMKDHHPLSRKQKRGKFRDSITFVLHTGANGSKREVLFRCVSKDDAFALAAGIQAIIDRIRNDRGKEDEVGPVSPPPGTPLAAAKPFSPTALSSPVAEDRWEV